VRTALGASTESDYQPILIERCPGASNLIVVFASYEGRWDFRSALADKHAHKVFLKDTTRRWYQLGADGFDGIDQVVEFLRVTIQELGVQKVCTLGSSLGGYGSLMFGDLIEADHSIAFAPQSFLTAELRAMERDDRWRQDFLRFEPGKFGDLGKIPNVRLESEQSLFRKAFQLTWFTPFTCLVPRILESSQWKQGVTIRLS
jgi:hypothetical protein